MPSLPTSIYSLSKNLKLFFFFPQRTWVSIFTGPLVPLVICDLWEKTLKRCSSSFSCFVSIPESQSTFLVFTWLSWVLGPRWNDAETCWPPLGCFRYSSWVGDQGPNSRSCALVPSQDAFPPAPWEGPPCKLRAQLATLCKHRIMNTWNPQQFWQKAWRRNFVVGHFLIF